MSENTERWLIVGAGSAGCVLANRLSADGSRSIMLLDDGPALEPNAVPDGIAGPSFFAAMQEPGRMHDDLLATRAASIEPSVYQRGRGVGGSSAVNAMVALRGNADLYRRWGWHDTEAAFERILIPTTVADDAEVGALDRAMRQSTGGEAAEMTRLHGKRVTAAEAYLWPVADRPNLTVRSGAPVARVLLEDRTVVGVELDSGETINADRVILAAGAIHSPTILLRSGIDTPGIGQGLQDHPSAVITLLLHDDVGQDTAGLPIASHLHLPHEDNLLQLLPMNHLGSAPETARLGAIMAALMTPVSRAGTVTVGQDGSPIIDFALLDDERDVRALTHAVRAALDLIETPLFADLVAEAYIDEVGTTADSLESDAQIATWLRANCADYVHATSTCAMGTVVDDRGAVAGYERLFVCDASVFPTIPDANTHFPTTMLAERLAPRLLSPA